jgi:hypothetical protein
VEAAEAFADGAVSGEALAAATLDLRLLAEPVALPTLDERQARAAMSYTTMPRAASVAYFAVSAAALPALGPEDDEESWGRMCDLVREVFGSPFRPLRPRAFPAHVVGLAWECYEAFPAASERYLILADALDDLGEGPAAQHCRRGGHVKGCHVLDWIAGGR